jgi:alpha-beta hydrolase superfamily lysophospholipase
MPFSAFVMAPFALCGVAAVALTVALATPLKSPPPLASIHAGAIAIDVQGLPELSRFQARDGTWLAYRLYPASGGDRLAIVTHGSSASSAEMNGVAKALAASGVTVVAIDARGHGASGSRGDIGYLGQLDDDLADLVAQLRKSQPSAKLLLIGHSAGGGFVARVAGEPLGREFQRFILLAPYLGYRAPTNRPNEGAGQWVGVDMPRIVALALLEKIGVEGAQALPTIAFANTPEARPFVTPVYSYRLMRNYAVTDDWQAGFRAAGAKIVVIAGANDELMNAHAYAAAVEPLGATVEVLPDVDHMGVVSKPAALAAIVAAAKL